MVAAQSAGLTCSKRPLSASEPTDPFYHLRNLPASIVPIGFRQATSGNIVPDDMDSDSCAAQRLHLRVQNGEIVIGMDLSCGGFCRYHAGFGEEERCDCETIESDSDNSNDEKCMEDVDEPAKPLKTRCGREMFVDIDGSFCMCMLCMGECDSEEYDSHDEV